MLVLAVFVAWSAAMGTPRFSQSQLRAANACKDEGVDPGYPLLLSPYVQSGQLQQARTLAKAKTNMRSSSCCVFSFL
jgi:hypothetical protein